MLLKTINTQRNRPCLQCHGNIPTGDYCLVVITRDSKAAVCLQCLHGFVSKLIGCTLKKVLSRKVK